MISLLCSFFRGPALCRSAVLALTWFAGASLASAAPVYVVVTAPEGAAGGEALPSQLAHWRQSGLVSSVVLIDSSDAKSTAFGSLTLLEFPDEPSYAQWNTVAAPALGQGLIVTRADSLAHAERTPRDSTRAIFQATMSEVKVSADDYRAFAKSKGLAAMNRWRSSRWVTSSTLYLARPGSAAPWQSLLVVEYPDNVAFSHRNEVTLASEDPQIAVQQSQTTCSYADLPAPDLSNLPPYHREFNVQGGLRIVGSELKGNLDPLIEGFKKFQPDAVVSTNYMTSSEGALAGLIFGISDLAPMGDDAKITDMMPYWSTFHYCPLEISVGTGGYEKRGSLWALTIVVNRDNPLTHISLSQLERTFGAERTGGWEIDAGPEHNLLYTAKYARSADSNIRHWDQLGLSGDFSGKEIQTYGYVAPGFAISFQRKLFHWSIKYNPNFKEYVETKEATDDADGRAVSSERELEAISKDKYGIGWAALMHAKDYPGVKVLAVSETDDSPAIALTPETVANRTYPLKRDAYIYVNRAPGRPLDPKVREFLRFVLSREGQQILAKVGFYYPLTPEYLQEQLKKLD
jgi:phosphate transport system substrate-binding protein